MSAPVHAVAADLPAVARTLTASFRDDPVQRWVFETAPDHDAGVADLMAVMVDAYFWLGHVYVCHGPGGVTGAALWAPPDRRPMTVGSFLDDLLTRMAGHLGDDMGPRLGELSRTSDYLPAEPHWYLGILGVDPGAQGQGIGARLVAPVLAACDAAGTLAHLESSNPRNLAFYDRLGFAETDAYHCGGPDGPRMTIMTRPAAGG